MLELPPQAPVVVSHVPFTVRRAVRWGECDPAGIVYTPRFLDYCVEAAEAWFTEVTGSHWNAIRRDQALGSPMVHCSLDFYYPLWPEDIFELNVTLDELSRATYQLGVAGHNMAGTHCFQGKLVGAMISNETMKAVRIPADFRARMEAYAQACAKQAADR